MDKHAQITLGSPLFANKLWVKMTQTSSKFHNPVNISRIFPRFWKPIPFKEKTEIDRKSKPEYHPINPCNIPRDPGSLCQRMSKGCPSSPPKHKVLRLHETILSFGEPGSLGHEHFMAKNLIGTNPEGPRVEKRHSTDPESAPWVSKVSLVLVVPQLAKPTVAWKTRCLPKPTGANSQDASSRKWRQPVAGVRIWHLIGFGLGPSWASM